MIAGLIFSAALAIRSTGVHHDDDLVHLQIARWVWQHPEYLLDDWGRPGFTALFAVPAGLGWLPARLFSGAITAATAWLAYLIAARLRVRLAAAVPLLLWLQPLVFTLSYTTLTETALAFYLTLAMWLYLSKRYALSAAVISLCVVTRHEAALFLALWLLALLYRARPAREWLWVFWAPVLHNVLAFVFLQKWPLLLLFQPEPTTEYGHGTLLTMLALWPLAAGLGPLLLALCGAPSIARRRGGALWIACAATYFVAHSLFYGLGLFGSGGYARFLVASGPAVAVCAAQGLSAYQRAGRRLRSSAHPAAPVRMNVIATCAVLALWFAVGVELHRLRPDLIINRLEWVVPFFHSGAAMVAMLCLVTLLPPLRRSVLSVAAVPVLALAAVVVQLLIVSQVPLPYRQCAPLRLTDRERAYSLASELAARHAHSGARIYSASPWVDEFTQRVRPPAEPGIRQRWAAARPADLLIWDGRHAASPRHALPLAELVADPSLTELWRSAGDAYDPVYCAVFQKQP